MSGEPNYSIDFTARVLGTEGPIAKGDALIFDPTVVVNGVPGIWRIATAANRAAGMTSADAIAITDYGGSSIGAVAYQASGVLPQEISGLDPLAPTTTKKLVRVSIDGDLERIDAYTAGDDVVGYAHWNGRVALHIGLPWDMIAAMAGAFTSPTGTGFAHVTIGALDAASKKVDLAATADVTGILARASGGTGLAVAGATGNVLTSDGTNWTSAALPASGDEVNALTITASPSGSLDMAGYGHLDSNGFGITVSAVVAPAAGKAKRFTIHNNADGQLLTLQNEDVGETAADRFFIAAGTDLDVDVGDTYVATYSHDRQRWVVAKAGDGGEVNTASNVGTGTGTIYRSKTGVNLDLKTLKAGANVTITNNPNDVTIAASGGSPAGSTGQLQTNNAGALGAPGPFAGAAYISLVSGTPTTNGFRMANAHALSALNGSSVDIKLVSTDGSNNIIVGSFSANQLWTRIQAPSQISLDVNSNVAMAITANGYQFGSGGVDFGGGVGVLGIDNRTTAPSTNPTAGGILYCDTGALKYRGSSGTLTNVANAEPHCPKCGTDVGVSQAENDLFGEELVHCHACEIRTGNGVVVHIADFFERRAA